MSGSGGERKTNEGPTPRRRGGPGRGRGPRGQGGRNGGGPRGGGGGRGDPTQPSTTAVAVTGRILVLHGNRQTGELLLSRMDKLRKKLQGLLVSDGGTTGRKVGYELVAIDAPHVVHADDEHTRTWWTTRESCEGLHETLQLLRDVWDTGLSPSQRNREGRRRRNRGVRGPSGSAEEGDEEEEEEEEAAGSSTSPVPFCGVLGFSQGARLAHVIALLHEHGMPNQEEGGGDQAWFPGLRFVILAAGYDAPLPDNLKSLLRVSSNDNGSDFQPVIRVPSLHVWGGADKLITPSQSRDLSLRYVHPAIHVHEGGHHVPMRADNVRTYLEFVQLHGCGTAVVDAVRDSGDATEGPHSRLTSAIEPERDESMTPSGTLSSRQSNGRMTLLTPSSTAAATMSSDAAAVTTTTTATATLPDDDNLQAQLDELEAIEAIYPDEFRLLMKRRPSMGSKNKNDFPIRYQVDLRPTDAYDDNDDDDRWWPPRPVALHVTYPPNYPLEAGPILQLAHTNNVMEFTSTQAAECLQEVENAAEAEQGMGCVLSCILAARDYFESGRARRALTDGAGVPITTNGESGDESDADLDRGFATPKIKPSSRARIEECNLQGLDIAESILKGRHRGTSPPIAGKGGSWTYTIGLVGKPSAGKSTFFNAATAFARQRDDKANALGGATMAPHPFTTIDPNVGFCLVPAPEGSCPEDGYESGGASLNIGSTHGRDPRGRRLLPVLLKDVAGLVPGAYQGRGRGNKFLNDLTDAIVLIHVLDGSGTADAEGNALGIESDGTATGASDPLQDLAWVRNELIEWVYSNVAYKWDAIRAKGQERLAKMFSGYGQPQSVTLDVLSEVEKFLESHEGRDRALSNLYDWDEGDIHRVVSTFLGVRFPMALAINKCDIATSKKYVDGILGSLPIHGAHAGVPMCAKSEMLFVRKTVGSAMGGARIRADNEDQGGRPPNSVWKCLQEAMELKEPILVFPVADFNTYASLPGLNRYATDDASLPSPGMVACIQESGGSVPSLWSESQRSYVAFAKRNGTHDSTALRDVLVTLPSNG